MQTQSFYTPPKAAQMLGCSEAEVISLIQNGRLKATFMHNIANYVITHVDLMAYLKNSRDFKTLQKMSTHRVILVDRDPKVQDIFRMELGRQGWEVKIATAEHEVSMLTDEFHPDVICVHLGATTRSDGAIRDCLDKARKLYKTWIVVYHNFRPIEAQSSKVQVQIGSVGADLCVSTERSVSALIDAVRDRFKPKPGAPGVR